MKSNVYKIITGVIIPIVYTVAFLLIGGTDHGPSAWIGYGFTMFAFIAWLAIPLLTPNSTSSYLFAATSATILGAYLGVQFVTGLILMIGDFENYAIGLVIELIILAIFAVVFFQSLRTDEVTAAKEQKLEAEVSAVRVLVSKSKLIVDRASDFEIRKMAQNVYDEIKSCPVHSNGQVKAIEDSISFSLETLNQAVMSGDKEATATAARNAISLIKERKELSKY